MEGQFAWGRQDEGGWRKGPWTSQEDKLLMEHVRQHGEGRWNSVSKITGLKRSGKSCRLRWVNYLRPDLKRGKITPQEESLIIELHGLWGNRWSTIARSLPGRTDNEIKNYWRTHFKKGGKPSKNIERARARFLKQRREMQSQRQRQDHKDQHGSAGADGVVRGGMSDVEAATVLAHEDLMLDMDFLPYLLLQGGSGSASTSEEGSSEEDGDATWGSLWNLEDVVDNVAGGACMLC